MRSGKRGAADHLEITNDAIRRRTSLSNMETWRNQVSNSALQNTNWSLQLGA